MNNWQKTIVSTLQTENFNIDNWKNDKIPEQYYITDVQTLAATVLGFLDKQKPAITQLCIFTDGIYKKSGANNSIDETVKNLFADFSCEVIWYNIPEILNILPSKLHAASVHLPPIEALLKKHSSNSAFLVLGSGSLTDLIKHALFLTDNNSPFLSIPTALTVTAYSSAFSVIEWNGAKRTKVSRAISANFWVESFLQNAPIPMSRAGYGDLLARFLAYGDWYLSYELGIAERYCEIALRLMEPFAVGLKSISHGFKTYPLPQATTTCTAAALAMAGIAMTVSQETSPLSGFEHVISHALDFLHGITHQEFVLHGEQVALGCLVSAKWFDWLLAHDSLSIYNWRTQTLPQYLQELNSTLEQAPFFAGSLSYLSQLEKNTWTVAHKEQIKAAINEFSQEYSIKAQRFMSVNISAFTDKWPQIQSHLRALTISAAELSALMLNAGLPINACDTFPVTTPSELNWAIKFSPFVRTRASLADILYWMKVLK